MYDQSRTIAEFLNAAAAKQPAPGGGSIAALAGALASSMGEMVVNYSIGKKGLEAHVPQLSAALSQFHRARQLLLGLMVEDQAAYESLTAARKLPKESAEHARMFAVSLLASIRVPQAMGATAHSVIELAEQIVDIVNPYLLSDLAVCADMAMATVRCASYNVQANLPSLDDAGERAQIKSESDELVSRAVAAIQRVSPKIWQRVTKRS